MKNLKMLLDNVNAYTRVERLLLSIATGNKEIIPEKTYTVIEDILKYMSMNGICSSSTGGSDSSDVKVNVVPSLPEVGEENMVYMIPSDNPMEQNNYKEFTYVNGEWEELGGSSLDEFEVEIPLEDWIVHLEDKTFFEYTVNHNLNEPIKNVLAHDVTTGEELFITHNIIDDTTIKLLSLDRVNAIVQFIH